MYAIARRSVTNQNVIRVVVDHSASPSASGNTAAALTFTSQKAARAAAKEKGEGFFILPLEVPKAKATKATKKG